MRKKFLSLFISYVMLFNLTAEVFAAPQLVSKEQERDINNTLVDAYNNNSSAASYNPAYYEKNYQNSLKNLANVSDQYQQILDVMYKAAGMEEWEARELDLLNDKLIESEKDLEKYKRRHTEKIKSATKKLKIRQMAIAPKKYLKKHEKTL